jgi:hypothetical protein
MLLRVGRLNTNPSPNTQLAVAMVWQLSPQVKHAHAAIG